jgi:hypothetical protein
MFALLLDVSYNLCSLLLFNLTDIMFALLLDVSYNLCSLLLFNLTLCLLYFYIIQLCFAFI